MATRGTVTIRLRLEFPNVRNAILGGVNPPPPSTVSVSRRIDFNVAHYTTDGIIDDRAFSLDTLSRYVEELQTYQSIVEYVNEAFLVIWLWRGHYPIELAGKTYKLPIHSITVRNQNFIEVNLQPSSHVDTFSFPCSGIYLGHPGNMELESISGILCFHRGVDTTSNQ